MSSIKKLLMQHSNLRTKRLTLRPVLLEDFNSMYSYSSDPENTRYLDTFSSEEVFLEVMANFWIGDPIGKYAIVLNDNKAMIGTIEVHLNEKNKSAEIGYIIDKHYWGNGYLPEAYLEIMDVAFEKLNLVRIYSMTDSLNVNSRRVLDRLGLKLEGVLQGDRYVDGKYYGDTAIYGMTKQLYNKNDVLKNNG